MCSSCLGYTVGSAWSCHPVAQPWPMHHFQIDDSLSSETQDRLLLPCCNSKIVCPAKCLLEGLTVSGMLHGSDLLRLAGGLCSAAYITCMHTALLLMQSMMSTRLPYCGITDSRRFALKTHDARTLRYSLLLHCCIHLLASLARSTTMSCNAASLIMLPGSQEA